MSVASRFTLFLIVYDPDDVYVESGFVQDIFAALDATSAATARTIVANIVPDSHSPRMAAYLRRLATARSQTTVLELENLGCGGTFNHLVKQTHIDTEFAIYMSVDAFLMDRQILEKFAAAFDNYPSVATLSPLSVFEDPDTYNITSSLGTREYNRRTRVLEEGTLPRERVLISKHQAEILARKVNRRSLSVRAPHPSIPLTFTAFRMRAFHEIGGFDAKFFVGHENNDFALRLLQAGYAAGSLENSFVLHKRLEAQMLCRTKRASLADRVAEGQMHWTRKWRQGHMEAFFALRHSSPLARSMALSAHKARRKLEALSFTFRTILRPH